MATGLATESDLGGEEIRRLIGQPTNAYDTHRPLLAEALIRTTGPILELGMGQGSTPGLHQVALRFRRRLVSYEDDARWFERFKQLAVSPHSLRLVANFEDAWLEEPWAVALVDHGQIDRRTREIRRLARWTEIVVVHDTEDTRYGYWSIYSLFQHRLDDLRRKPWTTVFSNHHDFRDWTLV